MEIAQTFLEEYQTVEIDKRLYFDRWSDFARLNERQKREVWGAVKHLTRRQAGLKGRLTRSRRLASPVSSQAE